MRHVRYPNGRARVIARFATVESRISTTFGRFYILAATLFLVFVAYLGLGRNGRARLADATTEARAGEPADGTEAGEEPRG